MVNMLLSFKKEAALGRDIIIVDAQVGILTGNKKIADYSHEQNDVKKAVINCDKWLMGKVTDEALFM